MTDKVAGPDGSVLSEGLGPNAHDVARESVDDALMIVESYGPWGADLNDAHRRQIVLADEVVRLRGLYEMAVRGRAEMRSALRQERRAEELHEGCQMPMEQAREIAASEASPDWYARGQDWGLADALTNGQSGDWVLDDIARAFAAGARAGAAVAQHTIKRMQSALEESASRSADYLRKAIKAEAEIARRDADAERERHAHTDWVDDDVRVRHPRA